MPTQAPRDPHAPQSAAACRCSDPAATSRVYNNLFYGSSALINTSGTGGTPRGVMLPHRSLLSNCCGAFELLRPLRFKDEVYLSYLPASHSYEHLVGLFFLPSIGTEIV